jgi:ATP-dependent Clp protease ATP-binding subunit ClpX
VKQPLRCSFCGRSEQQVARLVAGPNALICDQCVVKAARTLKRHPDEPVTPLPKDGDSDK